MSGLGEPWISSNRFAEDLVRYAALGPRSVFLGEKDGQSFFLLPKDERAASVEGV